jgi:ABC-type Na+ efflux pump permease subunit
VSADNKTDIERVDDLLKPSEVRNVSVEPENVTIQRLQNERVQFVLVVSIAAFFVFITAIFLVYAYVDSSATETLRDRIIIGFIAALSVSLGVLAGKRI